MSFSDSPPTILLADDDVDVRDMLEYMLRAQGYRVVCAEDGSQALGLIEELRVDLVLMDVVMPGRSGFSVCREIKARAETRLIPVVLITGLTSLEDRVEGIECGADDFINKPLHRDELLARVRSLVRLKRFTDELESAENVLFTLARSIEAKDPYTVGHCDRLSRTSVALAERLGLSEDKCIALRRAGIVHDIGKVAVPEYILLKPGPLNEAERAIIETHPVVGERICAPLKSFRGVLPIIRHHHERLNGTGYPDHLQGNEIPLTARILQTVDIYDALTTERPYRAALTRENAFSIMRQECRKGWWDESLVLELENLLALTPELKAACVA
ncbi:MAG TPA: HD domain-containing phosphohydrolase [Candidatus Acidoferrales bacterium]|jgi:putative two-component system response regulator|nr:HD domain-containing phosphohydrolase [Candidatus Acidoferrales bacterium]